MNELKLPGNQVPPKGLPYRKEKPLACIFVTGQHPIFIMLSSCLSLVRGFPSASKRDDQLPSHAWLAFGRWHKQLRHISGAHVFCSCQASAASTSERQEEACKRDSSLSEL